MKRLLAKITFNYRWYKWLLFDSPIPNDAMINGQYSPTRRNRQITEWKLKEPKE